MWTFLSFLYYMWIIPPFIALVVAIEVNIRVSLMQFDKSLLAKTIDSIDEISKDKYERNVVFNNKDIIYIFLTTAIPVIGMIMVLYSLWALLSHDSDVFNPNSKEKD